MKYGLITGLVVIAVALILYLSGVAFKPGMNYVTYIPFLIGLILNAQEFTKANDGFVTYGNVFGSCFKATAIITLLLTAWSLLSIMIFPHMMEEGLEIARQQMIKKGLPDDQIEMGLKMARNKVFVTGIIVFGTLFWGVILSLIAAAIPKKKGAAPLQNM